jgi:PKD repeat protein
LRGLNFGAATLLVAGWMLTPMSVASATTSTPAQIVSADPFDNTPDVLDNPGSVQTFAKAGDAMVAGGSFTQVRSAGSDDVLTRTDIFAFAASTGQVDPAFAPTLDGPVYAAVFDGVGGVIAGGAFKNVNGTRRVSLVKLRLSDGTIDPTFDPPALNGRVFAMRLSGGRLYLGGTFTKVGARNIVGLAALDPRTGAVDSAVSVPFSGTNNGGSTLVRAFDISPDGRRMVAVGNFMKVGDADRPQVAMFTISSNGLQLTDWETDRYRPVCATVYDSYVHDVSFAPDGSYFVIATSGGGFSGGSQSVGCDSATRWEAAATGSGLQPTWVDYTGNDTFWSVKVTDAAVYVGGHNRWVNNPFGSDRPGPGAVYVSGLSALDPQTGVPFDWMPTRTTGVGVFALYATDDGLWVGHDTDWIGHETHRKLAFFALAGGKPVPAASAGALPATIYQIGRTGSSPTDLVLYRVNAGGPALAATDGGPAWSGDSALTPSTYHNVGSTTELWSSSVGVTGAVPSSTPAQVFSSDRTDPAGGADLTWSFPVAAGTPVDVRLYFVNQDSATSKAGARMFDVRIDGRVMTWGHRSTPYDVVQDVGNRVGTMKAFTGTSDGSVTVTFLHYGSNDPIVSGIEIVRTCGQTKEAGAADVVTGRAFDGSHAGDAKAVASNGTAWSQARGAFMLSGTLYTGWADGHLCAASYDGSELGGQRPIELGLAGNRNRLAGELPQLTGMFFADNRIYYTVSGHKQLLYRYFSPEDDMVGAASYTAQSNVAGIDYSKIHGMLLVGGKLYYEQSGDGALRQIDWNGSGVVPSTSAVISGPHVDGIDWQQNALALGATAGTAETNTPPRAEISVSCNQLRCDFSGTGSSDSDGTVTSYAWDFGDGARASTPTTSHTYAAGGRYDVTLTVSDDDGATGEALSTVDVTATNSGIDFVDATTTDANARSWTVEVPATTLPGDGLVLVATVNSVSTPLSAPGGVPGWAKLTSATTRSSITTVWQRVGQSGDAGQTVTFTAPSTVKVNIALLVYRGTDATAPVAAFADATETTSRTTHTTPEMTVPNDASRVVSVWSDKSSATTTIAAPTGQTKRALLCGTAGGHLCTLVTDGGGAVAGGTVVGGLTATADAASPADTMWTIILRAR